MTKLEERTMLVATTDIVGFCKACQGKSNLDTFSMLNAYYK